MNAILSSSSDDENEQLSQQASASIGTYLKEKCTGTDEDPFAWWRMHEEMHPTLSQVHHQVLQASVYLVVPGWCMMKNEADLLLRS